MAAITMGIVDVRQPLADHEGRPHRLDQGLQSGVWRHDLMQEVAPDLPVVPGPLSEYRQQASFDWKQLRIALEDPEILRIKMNLWRKLEADPVFAHPRVTPPMEEQKKRVAVQLRRFLELNIIPQEVHNYSYKDKTKFMMAINAATSSWNKNLSVKFGLGVSLFTNALLSLGTERHLPFYDAVWDNRFLFALGMTEGATEGARRGRVRAATPIPRCATMPTTIEISFDGPRTTYSPGEMVSGWVHVHVDKPKRIRAVSIKFSGDASVWWTEKRGTCRTGENSHRVKDRIYSAYEKYFRHTLYFVGGEASTVTLDAGDHTYPFQCLLPQTLPNSFEGRHGYVRYTAKATISRWRSVEARVAFTVNSVVDLSMFPQAKEPVECVQSKEFTLLWGEPSGGPLTMSVRIPKGGYFPGQTIPFLIKVDNASSIDVVNVRGALIQVVTWHATRDNNTLETAERVVDLVFDSPVPANHSKAFCQELTVPPVLPSHLDNCNIIDLEYFLAVTARVSGAHFNLEIKAPILIGTAPEAEKSLEEKTFAEKSLSEKSLPEKSLPWQGDFAHPRGPPSLPSPDLPPPSYEESVLGQHQR